MPVLCVCSFTSPQEDGALQSPSTGKYYRYSYLSRRILGVMGHGPKSVDLPRLFAALADRTRLRLLNLMNGREVCVCYFVEILKQSQPKVSRHLAYLRRAGIVRARREGKWMHYSMERPADPAAAAILNAALVIRRRPGDAGRSHSARPRLVLPAGTIRHPRGSSGPGTSQIRRRLT